MQEKFGLNATTTLDENQIKAHKTINVYQLGDGNLVPAIKNVDISILIGYVRLNTDILLSNTPLLLS